MKQSFGKSLAVLLTSLVGLHMIISVCHAVPWKLSYKNGEKIPLQQVSIQSEKGHQFFGTFWSAQRVNYPPLPCYPLFLREAGYDVPVYALDSERGVFLVDDRAVDYEAIYKEREKKKQEETLLRSLALNTGLMSMEEFSLLEGESLFSSYAVEYTTNDLWLEIVAYTNSTASLVIHEPEGETNHVHDLFYTKNLNPPVDWRYVMRTTRTNVLVPELCDEMGFFKLAVTNGNLTVSTNITAQAMAEMLVPPWVTVTNAVYTGALVARGCFTNGNGCGLPIETGVILSSGNIAIAVGTNSIQSAGTNNLADPDDDLDELLGNNDTFNAAVLEFDIVSTNSFCLKFHYVYASEEYPNYISDYNDPMAIFVTTNWSGTNWIIDRTNNIALVPGTTNAVSVSSINGGCTYQPIVESNPQFYVDNADPTYSSLPEYSLNTPAFNVQYDGMTILLTGRVWINANVTNHIKIAIEDFNDPVYDSSIFIRKWAVDSCAECE